MLESTVQNLAVWANCYLECVHPCSVFLFTCAISKTTEHVPTELVSKDIYIKLFRASLIVVPIIAANPHCLRLSKLTASRRENLY